MEFFKLFKKMQNKNIKEEIRERINLKISPAIGEAPGTCSFFLSGGDVLGERLEDFINYDNVELEYNHCYIQYAFPLREKSKYNINAPVLTEDEIKWIKGTNGKAARYNLKEMYLRMLDFYGFTYDGDFLKEADNFSERSEIWLTSHNHNLKRISRILRSLSILGLKDESAAFYAILIDEAEKYPDVITLEVLKYWNGAANAE